MGQSRDETPQSTGAAGTAAGFSYDPETDRSLTASIATAIAAEKGVDPTALDFTLHEYVNPDALDALFTPRLDGTPRIHGEITLHLSEYVVTVTSDDEITVSEAPDGLSP